jgi:uracil-DNA glycosylase family 4
VKKKLEPFWDEVGRCNQCHRECGIHVPRPDRWPARRARVLILGEQPDREVSLGTGRDGVSNPTSDMRRLAGYLKRAGLDLDEVLYTTAVLCVPRDPQARPGRPALSETKHCTRHLSKLIELLEPRVIVPLGHTAIQALQWVYRDWTALRQYILNYDVGTVLEWNGTAVYPLYHTSDSTVRVRSEERQARDWARVPMILEAQERNRTPAG